jgi:hypothetical protein
MLSEGKGLSGGYWGCAPFTQDRREPIATNQLCVGGSETARCTRGESPNFNTASFIRTYLQTCVFLRFGFCKLPQT